MSSLRIESINYKDSPFIYFFFLSSFLHKRTDTLSYTCTYCSCSGPYFVLINHRCIVKYILPYIVWLWWQWPSQSSCSKKEYIHGLSSYQLVYIYIYGFCVTSQLRYFSRSHTPHRRKVRRSQTTQHTHTNNKCTRCHDVYMLAVADGGSPFFFYYFLVLDFDDEVCNRYDTHGLRVPHLCTYFNLFIFVFLIFPSRVAVAGAGQGARVMARKIYTQTNCFGTQYYECVCVYCVVVERV